MRITESKLRSVIRRVVKESLNETLNFDYIAPSGDLDEIIGDGRSGLSSMPRKLEAIGANPESIRKIQAAIELLEEVRTSLDEQASGQ